MNRGSWTDLRAVALAAVLALLPTELPAQDHQFEIIAACGASTGQSFFFEGGIVGPGRGGWQSDGINKGKFYFIRDKDGLDVIFVDVTGEPKSHRLDGGAVTAAAWDPENGSYLLLAYNLQGKVVETYLIQINKNQVGTVAWTTARAGGVSKRVSAFTAPCAPNIK